MKVLKRERRERRLKSFAPSRFGYLKQPFYYAIQPRGSGDVARRRNNII
ncbi:MAG: hypothetical protein LBI15_05995 [Dysgonamonadaceae bacterium]|nr:hypothetical protein [Dysgonamonadaceae bacterium]